VSGAQGGNAMRILTAALGIFLTVPGLSAQAPANNPTGKAGTIGFMHAIHSTNDIDTTLAFYQSVFGMSGQARPFQSTGPQILTDSPGATLRVAMTPLRGAFNFELTEFGNIERKLRQRPEIADPGAPMIQIIVRDLDAIVAAAKKANAPIVTKGGLPVSVPTPAGSRRAILMRDPDGYFVEAIQGTPAAGAADGAVLGATIGLTVRDMDETLRYWNGLLSIGLTADAMFSSDPAVLDLLGLPAGASYRMAHGVIPGSTAAVELMEVRGVPRKDFDLRVTDANASGMALRVGRIREVLANIKAAGGRVLSRNGELVEWSDTVRNVFVKDPNGFNLELVGSADPSQ
jgi:catechol 2,3-dioxygenase-like lactoylglutathione lyase family enzyme